MNSYEWPFYDINILDFNYAIAGMYFKISENNVAIGFLGNLSCQILALFYYNGKETYIITVYDSEPSHMNILCLFFLQLLLPDRGDHCCQMADFSH
jgi:hypothetical protein